MKISVNSLIEKCIWLLTLFLFSSFLIFDTYTWGKYAFFVASALVMLLSAVIHEGVIRIRPDAFHGFLIFFILYVAMTALWAIKPSDATEKAITLIQILLCASMLFIHYDRENNIRSLLNAVMWSGYVVTLYAIAVYGLDSMLASAQDVRLDNRFANTNFIAMAAALSCVLQWHELTEKRNIWSAVLMIPAVVLITATQSRKALVFLGAGILGIYIMRMTREKGMAKKIIKLITYVVVGYAAVYLLLQLPIFDGSMERMRGLLAFWSDSGEADHSTVLRNDMVSLGIHFWKQNPLAGIGIGNPHILAKEYVDFDSYLHNNFVEMLCGGGLVGFALYYGMFIYLVVCLFKYRKADYDAFSMGFIWLGLILIMNYGMVTYYSKLQWYYLAVHFLNVSQMRRKYKEMMENEQAEKTPEVPDIA